EVPAHHTTVPCNLRCMRGPRRMSGPDWAIALRGSLRERLRVTDQVSHSWLCSKPSRRLLRGHLVHLAGLEINADAVDPVEIGAGHPHEARMIGIVDGVDLSVLV